MYPGLIRRILDEYDPDLRMNQRADRKKARG